MPGAKFCIKCGLAKPRSEFYPCSKTPDKRTEKCKECYATDKAAELAAKQEKKKIEQKHLSSSLVTGIPASWAACKKIACPSPTSKCWLSYQKALCCCECLGYEICKSPDRCKNNAKECMKWYSGAK